MPGPLLTTKLFVPKRRRSLVARPRLLALLRRADDARRDLGATLVSVQVLTPVSWGAAPQGVGGRFVGSWVAAYTAAWVRRSMPSFARTEVM